MPIKIETSTAPIACRNGTRYDEVLDAAVNLKPGQWFVWENAPNSYKANVRGWMKSRPDLRLRAYRDAERRVLIAHADAVPDGTSAARPADRPPDRSTESSPLATAPQIKPKAAPIVPNGVRLKILTVLNKAGRGLLRRELREAINLSVLPASDITAMASEGLVEERTDAAGTTRVIITQAGISALGIGGEE